MIEISIKDFELFLLPIIPYEIVKPNDVSAVRSILYEEDVEKNNFFCTGLFQDLSSDSIEKVFACSGIVAFPFLKNIPKYIIDKIYNNNYYINSVTYYDDVNLSYIVFNPVFESKYIDYILPEVVDRLYTSVAYEYMKYKSFPKDFDIRDIVTYDKKKEVVRYHEDIVLKYKHLFYFDTKFIMNAKMPMRIYKELISKK